MNTLPRLFMDPSWAMISSLRGTELAEFIMLALMSLGLIVAVLYGIYTSLFRRDSGRASHPANPDQNP